MTLPSGNVAKFISDATVDVDRKLWSCLKVDWNCFNFESRFVIISNKKNNLLNKYNTNVLNVLHD